MADMTRVRMTADEFLALPETTQITELIDGEVIVSPSAIAAHQEAVLTSAVFLKQKVKDGTLWIAPMDLKFDELNTVQPDVFWVSATNERCRLVDGKYWEGAPDLVVEVLSPATAHRDYGAKFNLYERYGVREYWLIDPAARFVQVYALEAGRFARKGVFGADEQFISGVLGDMAVEVKGLLGGA